MYNLRKDPDLDLDRHQNGKSGQAIGFKTMPIHNTLVARTYRICQMHVLTSVPPYVFGSPGSGSVIYLYGIRILPLISKIMRENLDFYCFVTSQFLFLWRNLVKKFFCCHLEEDPHLEPDLHPDPYLIVTAPERWLYLLSHVFLLCDTLVAAK
jgi:hypothetical protein